MAEYEEDRILVNLMQHYPLLYDKSLKDYKDNNKKSNAWETIASAMGSTVEEVQKVWKNLRERYGKERRTIKNIPSGSEAADSSWPLFSAMSFIEPHMQSRKRISNVSSRPSSGASSSTVSQVCSPLGSPSGSVQHTVWNTYDSLTGKEPEESESDEELGVPVKKVLIEKEGLPSTSKSKASEKAEKTRGVRSTASQQIEETLACVTDYLKSKEKPNKNIAFGEYVGLALIDMPLAEQNYKRMKIMEVLSEPYPF